MKTDLSTPPLLKACEALVRPNGVIVGSEIAKKTREAYPTLLSTIPCNAATPFIASLDGRSPVSHAETLSFIRDFGGTLHALGVGKGQRVALVLPNGPELGMAILAVSNWTSCVPLSATGAISELEADLARCGPDLIIGPYTAGPLPISTSSSKQYAAVTDRISSLAKSAQVLAGDSKRDWTVHHEVKKVAEKMGIPYVGLLPDPEKAGPFKLWVQIGRKNKAPLVYSELPFIPDNAPEFEHEVNMSMNTEENEALVLFTSGTTGNKKLVPHFMGDILTAATVIALSWKLQPDDVNCNMMPLFHVGGIVRQIFSPLVSSSAVICCPSFDASLFWAMLSAPEPAFNWYYAAPTMHQIILQTGEEYFEKGNGKGYKLKMIANAAGGLLPSLAKQLRESFHANVLPSYGMTECMPISSPPADYDLSKPGTSGVPVGPEVAILNTATCESLPVGEEGPICVRGAPCFRGYGVLANDPTGTPPKTFLKGGWFDTGDLGYLDEDGYLYITGRSKEVINRGGEIIAPMEVEEAVMSHPEVAACAAFSVGHDILQETVGICVVTKNPGSSRLLDLPSLQAFCSKKLATPKWPQCLVFMNGGLPKSHTNKLLRVKLGSRLGLPELNDQMTTWERTFEAECPAVGTPLDEAIPCRPIVVSAEDVQSKLRKSVNTGDNCRLWVANHPTKSGALVAYVGEEMADRKHRRLVVLVAQKVLSAYEMPTHVVALNEEVVKLARLQDKRAFLEKLSQIPLKAQERVTSLLHDNDATSERNQPTNDPVVSKVMGLFVSVLDLDPSEVSVDSQFFHVGGSSMRASQLASKIRTSFGVPFSGAEIFHHATPEALAKAIQHRQKDAGTKSDGKQERHDQNPKILDTDRSHHDAPFGHTYMGPVNGLGSDLFQLLPLFVVFPVWQIARYFLFFTLLVEKYRYFWNTGRSSDIVSFLIAYTIFQAMWSTFCPLVLVVIKWTVIGRYQPGRYPMRGHYYLKWWFVDVCRKMIPRGVWGSSDGMLRVYYRLLGATIGPGARISLDCELAEYDLVEIGANAAVDLSTVRGFCVDNGAMVLGPVKVGNGSSVGMRSVVAPFTSVPDGKHLGPVTSSYDVSLGGSLHEKHARVNRMRFPETSLALKILVGAPIMFLVSACSQIPPLFVLYLLLKYKARAGEEIFFGNWNELIYWLCSYDRIPYFVGIRLARALLSPFFYMGAAIVVKKTVIGKFQAGPRNVNSDWENFRYYLAASLFTRKKLQKCTELMGRHYESVSILYRTLGSKIGKRVFWPGSQPITDGTFDLLEIGDDAVFGSRSSLICTTLDHAERVILCAGANVSDNCVVMAGSVIGKNAVLGSNSICPEGTYLPTGSVWFGSNGCKPTCLSAGDASEYEYQPFNEGSFRGAPAYASANLDQRMLEMEGDESTVRPFGKAFYLGQAKGYTVLKLPFIISFTVLNRIFQVCFHVLPQMVSVQFGAVLLYTDHALKEIWRNSILTHNYDFYQDRNGVNHDKFLWWNRDFDNNGHHHTFGQVYMAILCCFLLANLLRVFLWLAIELLAKMILIGKRKAGRYNYDSSSYAQRWEMYQLVGKIRKLSRLSLLDFIRGTPFMNMYFRMLGCKIGRNSCLYPTGGDPYMPEPDLVKIGKGCVIDCASIVCHLNTKGNFELQKITIEDKCTLRTRSRVQQGVVMETGSQLLEKSIVMTGEILESRSVWQGGPASFWFQYKDEDLMKATYQPPSFSLTELTKNQEIEMKSMALLRSTPTF